MPNSNAQSVLADLSRSLEQDAPSDVLQYCADYFHDRLREQRSGSTPNGVSSRPISGAARKGPGGMSLPFMAGAGANVFSHHVSQPSPFSEHGPAGSPFGAGGSSSLAQRRATTAFGGAGVGPLGGATAGGGLAAAADAAPPPSGLAQLAEEREDDQSPGAPGVAGGAGSNNFFGGFSFDGSGAAGSPFGGPASGPAGSHRFPPQASSSGAAHAGDDLVVPSYALGRRTSVSAESLVPSHGGSYPGGALGGGGGGPHDGEETTPTLGGARGEPKTPAQLERIKGSIAQNFLFRNLDDDQERDVLAAMKEVSVRPGELVIEQGAAGDYFYVVEKGALDIFVMKQSTVDDLGASEMEQKWGKRVHTCNPGSSFGELALMYNAPRAATVIATEESTLWALDRISFRTILYDHTSRKRRMYESFLATVPILSSLEGYERAKIADALESRTFQPGEVVIEEGEAGDEFYLIESGDAEVSKQSSGVVGRLGKGDYFGELALLNREPRAATIRAAGTDGQTLRVGALGEKAFTRLLGPVREIMARTAGERYGLRSAAYGQ